MVTTIILNIGLVLLGIGIFAFMHRFVHFLLIVYFGKNISVSFVDNHGEKQTRRINVESGEELLHLLKEAQQTSEHEESNI